MASELFKHENPWHGEVDHRYDGPDPLLDHGACFKPLDMQLPIPTPLFEYMPEVYPPADYGPSMQFALRWHEGDIEMGTSVLVAITGNSSNNDMMVAEGIQKLFAQYVQWVNERLGA